MSRGRYRREFDLNLKRFFRDGKLPGNPLLKRLVALLKDAKLYNLNQNGIDDLERAFAAYLISEHRRALEAEGWQLDSWMGRHFAKEVIGSKQQHFDHAYKLKRGKEERFIFEPYELSGEMLTLLAKLTEAGYGVTISNRSSLHFPGHTLHVEITKPKKEAYDPASRPPDTRGD